MGGLRKREMVECELCQRKVWRQHLTRHLKQHTEERTFVCNSCGLGFTHKCALKRHVVRTCKSSLQQRDYVTEPILLENLRISDESIPSVVLQENSVQQEIFGNTSMSVSCQESSGAGLITKDSTETIENAEAECKFCHEKFAAEVFDLHLKQHTSIKENEKIKCDLCGLMFCQESDLLSHKSENNCSQMPPIAINEGKCVIDFAKPYEVQTVECEFCHRNINKNVVKRHIKMHTEERPYKCECCGCGFNFRGNLTKHKLLTGCGVSVPVGTHQSKPPIEKGTVEISQAKAAVEHCNVRRPRLATSKCPICHRLVHGQFMKRHMKQHTEDRKYKCPFCSLGFIHRQARNNHLTKNTCVTSANTESIEKKYSSSESHEVPLPCLGSQSDQGTYESHGNIIKKKIQCQNCGTLFSNRSNLYRHLKNKKCTLACVEELRRKIIQNQVFSKPENTFLAIEVSSSDTYKYKESANSSVKPRSVASGKVTGRSTPVVSKETCLVCRKEYSSRRKLEDHMEEHMFKRTFRCVLCPKKYYSLGKCRRHMQVQHATISASVCRLCSKQIDNFGELEDHLSHHRGDRIYKCMLCNKVILKQMCLKSHFESHAGKHGESGSQDETSENSKGTFPKDTSSGVHYCTVCKLVFSSPSILASHMKTHALDSSCDDNEGSVLSRVDDVTVFITDSNDEEDTERRLGNELEGITNGNNQNSDPLSDCEGDVSVLDDNCSQIMNVDYSSYARNNIPTNNESSTPVLLAATDPSIRNIDVLENVGQHCLTDTGSRIRRSEETYSRESVSFSECSASSDYALVTGEVSKIGGNKEDHSIEGSNDVFLSRMKEVTVYITENGAQETGFNEEFINGSEVRSSENFDPLTRDNIVNDSSYSGFTCNICNEQFLTRGSLEAHMSTHIEGRFHICNVCGENFSQKNYLRKHMAEHGENQKFRCSVCWVDFLFDSDLANHMNTHVTKAMNYDCLDCGRKFIKKSGLVRHSSVHSKNRLFTCDLCQLTFISKESLHEHLKNHTENNEQAVEGTAVEGAELFDFDNGSGKATVNVSALSDSKKLDDKESDGVHLICPVCAKVCKTKGSYVLHVRVHSANRKYKCEVCNRKYGSKIKLRKHQRKYNHEYGTLPNSFGVECRFNCEGDTFGNVEGLQTPQSETIDVSTALSETQGKDITDISFNIFQHSCNICGKGFRSKSELVVHQQMHAAGERYPCFICKSSFITKIQLDEHHKEHSGTTLNSVSGEHIKDCKEPNLLFDTKTTELLNESETDRDLTVSGLREHNMRTICSETHGPESHELELEKFVCDICGKKCKKRSSLVLHVKYHKPFQRCKCNFCDLTFPNRIKLRMHERKHRYSAKMVKGVESATETSWSFDDEKSIVNEEDEVREKSALVGDQDMQVDLNYRLTVKEKHSEMVRCKTACEGDQSPNNVQKLEIHESSDLEPKKYHCGICGKHCKKISSFVLHQKMHLSYKGYDCRLCHLSFTSRIKYRKHQCVHKQSGKDEEVFDMEGRLFPVIESIKDKVVEEGKESCDVNAVSMNSENGNYGVSDEASSEVYNCRSCYQAFSDKIKLLEHECEYKHNENSKNDGAFNKNDEGAYASDIELLNDDIDKEEGRYVCQMCGKKCTRKNSLVLHQKVHSFFKRYTCRICSLTFQNKAKLYKHQKIHRMKNVMMEMDKTEVESPNVLDGASGNCSFGGGNYREVCGDDDVMRTESKGLSRMSLEDEISRDSGNSLSASIEYTCNVCLNKYMGKTAFIHHLQMNHGNLQLSPDKSVGEFNSLDRFINSKKTPLGDEVCGEDKNYASNSKKYAGSVLAESERTLSQVQTEEANLISERKICYCIICKMEFKRPSGFARHMKIHGSMRYECNVCLRVFSTKVKLKKHKKYHLQKKVSRGSFIEEPVSLVGQEKPYDKPTSKEYLNMMNEIDEGIVKERISGEKLNVCNICGMEFQKSCGLASHMRTHSIDRPYSCNFCGRRFNSVVTLEMHKKSTHRNKTLISNPSKLTIKIDHEKPVVSHNGDSLVTDTNSEESEVKMDSAFYPCTFCGLKFQRPCSLGSHLRVHLHRRSYCCRLCSRTFKSSRVLQKHEKFCQRKRGAVKNDLVETVSFGEQEETGSRINLSKAGTECEAFVERQHKDTVNLGDLVCTICGLKFQKSCGLQSHLRTHLNNRPYMCKLCHGTFTTAYTLKCHEKHRHKHQEEKLTVKHGTVKKVDDEDFRGLGSCTLSPKERTNLDSDKSVNSCEISGKTFNKSCDVADSGKAHSGRVLEREVEGSLKLSTGNQYKCKVCGETFSDAETFRLHSWSHDGEDETLKNNEDSVSPIEKQYSCKICRKKFRHRGNYKVHLWSHKNKNDPRKVGIDTTMEPKTSEKGKNEWSELFDYMSVKTIKSGQMKIECKLCGKLMAHRGNFVSHIRGHWARGEVEVYGKPELDVVVSKPFRCSICDKPFKTKWALDRHVHVHTKSSLSKSYQNGCDLKNFDGEPDHLSVNNIINPSVVENPVTSDFHVASPSRNSSAFAPNLNNSSENGIGFSQHNYDLKLESRTCKFCCRVFKYRSMCVYHMAKHSENDFNCTYCSRSFYNKREFLTHTHSHENAMVDSGRQGHEKLASHFEISLDGDSLTTKSDIISGKSNLALTAQERDKNLSCSMCGKYLPTHKSFRKHQKMHLQQSKNRCVICIKKYKSRSSYRKHLRIHHPEFENKCSLCGGKCEGSCQYNIQEKDEAVTDESITNEGLNIEAATPPLSLRKGLRHKGEKEISSDMRFEEDLKFTVKELSPEVLPSSSGVDLQGNRNDISSEQNLKDYVVANTVVDNTKAKPFICSVCGKGFKYMKYIKLHMEVHLEQSFKCEICHKSSRSALRLKRHMVSHKLGKRFNCEDCGSAFTQMSSLKKHCQVFHRSKPKKKDSDEGDLRSENQISADAVASETVCAEKPAVQAVTDSTETITDSPKPCNNSDLEEDEDDSALTNRPLFGKSSFVCPICGKGTSSGSHLDSHMIRHSQEKPFKCPLCQKFFKRDYTLRKHIREIHSADPGQFHPKNLTSSGRDITVDLPYKCSICDKGFIYDTSLKAHMMFHMRESSLFAGECEEEIYECAVETNEDDGILSVEPVRLEDNCTNKYLKEEKEFSVEDMAIDIKEELVDDIEEDYEDLLSEEFLLNDFDLMEKNAGEDLVFTGEMDSVSESIDFSSFSEGCIFSDESGNVGNGTIFSLEKEQDNLYIPEDIEANCSSEC